MEYNSLTSYTWQKPVSYFSMLAKYVLHTKNKAEKYRNYEIIVSAYDNHYLQLAPPGQRSYEHKTGILSVQLVPKVMRSTIELHSWHSMPWEPTSIMAVRAGFRSGFEFVGQLPCIPCVLQSKPWGMKQFCLTSFLFFL